MQVEVVEMGDRPNVWTKARRFAPEGARVIGNALEPYDFADIALILLDWSNSYDLMPAEVAIPLIHIRVMKKMPEYTDRNLLTVDARLDVEDVFGHDEVTAEIIADLVQELQTKVREQIEFRRST